MNEEINKLKFEIEELNMFLKGVFTKGKINYKHTVMTNATDALRYLLSISVKRKFRLREYNPQPLEIEPSLPS